MAAAVDEPVQHADVVGGRGRTVLVVVAHADDAALFLGGTILRWADAGWRVVCVRVTDDRFDSVGLGVEETIDANREQFQRAAAALGIDEIVELGLTTDTLGDASEVALRERIIREIRRHRPYALVSFDPDAAHGEDNLDHKVVAAAVDEAFWTSQFELHHPEHRDEGLEPHGCFERWYFGRSVTKVTDVVDIATVLERKIDAALCHDVMLRNLVHQLRLQARTGGWKVPVFDAVLEGAPLDPVLRPMLRAQAAQVGARYGLAAAEEFRVVRFGGLQRFLELFGEPLDPAGVSS